MGLPSIWSLIVDEVLCDRRYWDVANGRLLHRKRCTITWQRDKEKGDVETLTVTEGRPTPLHLRHLNSKSAGVSGTCSSSKRILSASGAWPQARLSSISRWYIQR